jgi:cytochrome c
VALAALLGAVACAGLGAQEAPRFGLGRPATPSEIAGWDIDVRPDGLGLKPGRGTVAQGQAIYDAKCAACHGTFGESTRYFVLAGGVKPDDLKTGRASGLITPGVQRTLGTKLNHATTLWDYIYRAMPWNAPQTLSIDETYALTAYVLNLKEIVPPDFELSDRSILNVPMPNRNGLTTGHGMMSVRGKPDVQGRACMKDCFGEIRVASSLPEYARNSHGNLSQQIRRIGALAGIDTSRYEIVGAAAVAKETASAEPDGADLIKANGCVACHTVESHLIGPAFKEVGSKYAGNADAESHLVSRIKSGGVGTWGQIPMPPQTGLKEEVARAIARWILAGAR